MNSCTVDAQRFAYFDDFPGCCKDCSNHEPDDSDDVYARSVFFCKLGLMLPVRKKTCKRQVFKKIHKQESEDING